MGFNLGDIGGDIINAVPGATDIIGFAGEQITVYAVVLAAVGLADASGNSELKADAQDMLNNIDAFNEVLLTQGPAVTAASVAITQGNPKPFIALYQAAVAKMNPPPTNPPATPPPGFQANPAQGKALVDAWLARTGGGAANALAPFGAMGSQLTVGNLVSIRAGGAYTGSALINGLIPVTIAWVYPIGPVPASTSTSSRSSSSSSTKGSFSTPRSSSANSKTQGLTFRAGSSSSSSSATPSSTPGSDPPASSSPWKYLVLAGLVVAGAWWVASD